MLVLKQMATEDVVYSERSTGANREIPRQHSLSHSRPLGFPDRELALWRNLVEKDGKEDEKIIYFGGLISTPMILCICILARRHHCYLIHWTI